MTMSELLDLFGSQVRIAVNSVLRVSGRENNYHARDELTQDARILLARYAGIMPGWGYNRLETWYEIAEDDLYQVKLLIVSQLKRDLGQIANRQSSLGLPWDEAKENDLAIGNYDRADDPIVEAEFRERYPVLTRNVLDGETQQEIADALGVHRNTVVARIATERQAFSVRYLRDASVRVNGDESMVDLAAKYAKLTETRPSKPVRSNQTGRTGHRQVIGGQWYEEHCLDCNEPCIVNSDDLDKICECCKVLSGGR